jgi:hypothetical protein
MDTLPRKYVVITVNNDRDLNDPEVLNNDMFSTIKECKDSVADTIDCGDLEMSDRRVFVYQLVAELKPETTVSVVPTNGTNKLEE